MKTRDTLLHQTAPAIKASNHLPPPTGGPVAGTRRRLSELRSAISEGWEIVQPIFARPLWSSLNDHRVAFHFVLQRDRATRLLTVPETKTVARFIHERSLAVDEARQR